MSLYGKFTTAAALGLEVECRNDADVVFSDSPGVGAAGGAEASPDASAQETTQDTGTDTHADVDDAARAATTDDDDADPDLRDDAHRGKPWENDPDFKRTINKTRTLQRKLAKYRPIVEQVRAFGITDKLGDVVRRAQRFDEVQPLLRGVASGGDSSRAAEQPQEYKPPPFDRSSIPFDTTDPAGAWMVDYAERQHHAFHQVVGVVHQMAREIHSQREGTQAEQRTREVTGWRGEMETASAKIPENWNGIPLRTLFKDAVIGAFHQARVNGGKINGRVVTPREVIQHYLKEYKPQKTNSAAASAAAQQRIAESNKTRPSSGAFAGGTPTGARDITNERVGDVNRRLVGRRYLGRR